MAASEADVLEVVRRTAALGKISGVNATEIAALGAAMVSMGVDSESAATAVRNILLEMQAGAKASTTQEAAWRQLGLTAEQVAKRIQTEGIGAILDVFDRINKKAPEVRASILRALFDKRAVDAAGPLLNRLEVLHQAIGLVGDQSRFAGSTMREFAVRADTSANKFQIFRNHLDNLAIVIGAELLPVVTDLTEKLAGFIKGVSDSESSMKRWGIVIAGLAAAFGPFVFGIGLIFSAFGGILTKGSQLIGLFLKLRTALLLAAAGGALAFGPASAIVIGLAALAGGIAFLATRQTDAERAADTHKAALERLRDIVAKVKLGIPGAIEELKEFREEHLKAAEAALKDAKAQVQALKSIAEAEIAATAGPVDPETLGKMVAGDPRVQRKQELIAQLTSDIAGFEAELRKVPAAAQQVAREVGNISTSVDETTKSVRVFHGTKLVSTAALDDLGRVVSVTKAAGEEAEKAGEKTAAEAEKTAAAVRQIPQAAQATAPAVDSLNAIGTAIHAIPAAAQAAVPPTQAAIQSTADGAVSAGGQIRGAFEDAAAGIVGPFENASASTEGVFRSLVSSVSSLLRSLVSVAQSVASSIAAAMAQVRADIARTRAAASAASSSSAAPSGGGGGFHRGGLFRGKPGKDTNLAWLTDREFIMNPKAVSHWGVQFMHAINSLKSPFEGFFKGGLVGMSPSLKLNLPAFDGGGLMNSISGAVASLSQPMVPSFAGGGFADAPAPRAMGTVNLNIGGQEFPMQAPVDVVGTFMRFARKTAITQIGKAPGWAR